MHPSDLKITDFDYQLPNERIAAHPLPVRDTSKLLVYKNGEIQHDLFYNIKEFLPNHSLLVFNNTRVIQSRLKFKLAEKPIEVFCLEPYGAITDVAMAMQATKSCVWECLIGNAKAWKSETLTLTKGENGKEITLKVARIPNEEGKLLVQFNWSSDLVFCEILSLFGETPLPPYIKRATTPEDTLRYQTIYAQEQGAVAAPTAGLHFTENVFKDLQLKQIQRAFVTLHVGAGTFRPVKSETMADHEMHAEEVFVSIDEIQLLARCTDKIVVVGTTSMRTVESLYWWGAMLCENPGLENLPLLTQWIPYDFKHTPSRVDALNALVIWLKKHNLSSLHNRTALLIAPGYNFKCCDGIVTNFHQPKSTLLLLIAAMVGSDWEKIYQYALQHDFRFLSYGDSSLLWYNP